MAILMLRATGIAVACLWLSACALLQPPPEPIVRVVGLSALPSEGLELRFGVRLRIQNPRDQAIEFDGVAISLDLDERGLATGVSAQTGTIGRFDETIIEVPVSVSALTALRQAIAQIGQRNQSAAKRDIPYSLSGRLSSTGFNDIVFRSTGNLSELARSATPR